MMMIMLILVKMADYEKLEGEMKKCYEEYMVSSLKIAMLIADADEDSHADTW